MEAKEARIKGTNRLKAPSRRVSNPEVEEEVVITDDDGQSWFEV